MCIRDRYTVTGRSVATGKAATLATPAQGRKYNWADVTLEVYAIKRCDLFSPSDMAFSEVYLWDTNFQELTPQWSLSPASPCGGSIIVDPESHGAVHIRHDTGGRSRG